MRFRPFVVVKFGLLPLAVSAIVGCVNSDLRLGSVPDESAANPHPATYGPDNFSFPKWQKRRPATDSIFFFKRCSVMDGRTYWSKTSYDCSPL